MRKLTIIIAAVAATVAMVGCSGSPTGLDLGAAGDLSGVSDDVMSKPGLGDGPILPPAQAKKGLEDDGPILPPLPPNRDVDAEADTGSAGRDSKSGDKRDREDF